MKNVLFALSIFLLLMGCDNPKSTQGYIDEAKQLIIEQEYGTATIELKNLLSQDPKSAEGRFLLGKTYLMIGQLPAAEKELDRALEYEYPMELVIPLLVRTQALMGNSKAYEDYEKLAISNETLAEIYTITVLGNITQGNLLAAITVANKAVSIGLTDDFFVQLSQAWLAANDEQISIAIQKSTALLAEDTEYKDALLLTGILYTVNEEFDLALEHYESYLTNFASYYFIQLNYLSILVSENQLEKAESYVNALLAIRASDPMLHEYKADIAYRQKNFVKAAEYAAVTLSRLPNSFKANFINGVSQYQLGNKELAYSHLIFVESIIPKQHIAYQILMSLKFELGYIDQAVSSLDTLNNFSEEDYNLLSNASWSLLKSGEIEKAQQYIQKMENIDAKSAKSLVQRGMLKQSLDSKSGIKDITEAITINPEYVIARVALLFSHLENEQFIEALEVADNWIEELPDSADGHNAKGLVYKKTGDTDLAKASFNRALNMDPKNIGANFQLSSYDISDLNYTAAFEKLSIILAQNSLHLGALNKLTIIANQESIKPQVLALADSLIKNNPNDIKLNVAMARVYIFTGHVNKATDLLTAIEETAKGDQGYLYLYGEVNLGNKNYQKAEQLFKLMLTKNNAPIEAHTGYLIALEKQTKYQQGLSHIEDVKKIFPTNNNFAIYQAKFLLLSNELQQAKQILENLPEENHNKAFLIKVKAQLYAALKDYPQAVQIAQGIYEANASDDSLFYYAQALHYNAQHELALSTLNAYTKEHGSSSRLERLKAQIQLTSSPKDALAYYQQQVDNNKNDHISLNNLAWAAIQTNDFQLGLSSALKAKQLKPENPYINHTLAIAYLGLKQYDEAETLLTNLYEQSPENEEYALHYAEVLVYLKKVEVAKTVLAPFESKKAKDLLNTLN